MGRRYLHTISKREALRRIEAAIQPMDAEEEIETPSCPGRITARPVYARVSNPPFTSAAMDGYALSFESSLHADLGNPVALTSGIDAFALNTGDPMPPGTNAVIMVEDVEHQGTTVVIRKPASLWQHVRLTGEDIIEGDMLFPAHHFLATFDVGLLLAAGVNRVAVKKRPRLLIIPTGQELIDIVEEPEREIAQPHLIDFNSYTLMAMGKEMGFDVAKGEIARDDNQLRAILKRSVPSYDVLVINAGSSAGTEDSTEAIISESGRVIFHGVAMMPGKPVMFGIVEGKPVFGIPGYPVSAAISFKVFLGAVHERFCTCAKTEPSITAVTPYKIPSALGVEEVLRVNLPAKDGKYYAYPLPRGAGRFSSLSRADGLVTVPPNVEGYDEGTEVEVVLLRPKEDLQKRLYLVGSHDLSLDVLRDMIKGRRPDMDLISAHVGSLSGITAMAKGIVDLATTHILDDKSRTYNIPAVEKYLKGRECLLVNVARRMQGLLLAKGNPKGIVGIRDLARSDVAFVNRQAGSGTRILLDLLLKDKGIDPSSIQGYDREEATHAATAILVKEGIADAGLAIYAVSRAFSLDFIPLAEEEYDLLVTKEFSERPEFGFLLELLTSAEFASRLSELGGYNTEESGKLKYTSKGQRGSS